MQRTAIMSSKGQLVIPSELRKKYGLNEGARVIITEHQGRLILEPGNHSEIVKLRGSLRGLSLEKSLLQVRQSARTRENRR